MVHQNAESKLHLTELLELLTTMKMLTRQSSMEILLEKALARERQARELAEKILEEKSRELYDSTIKLAQFADQLSLANLQLEHELDERKRIESQLVQVQKLESLGQLAAGVAHEINNPISFVISNISSLKEYTVAFKGIFEQLDKIRTQKNSLSQDEIEAAYSVINAIWQSEDMNYILGDVDALVAETQDGLLRVKEIVQNLKSFARLDESELNEANLNECIESTLKLAWNELKYKCEIDRQYGDLPVLNCAAGQLNQVFMNLVVNAAQAIKNTGKIIIKTQKVKNDIVISISDNGEGIPPENLKRLFDPFFTTKPVGSGTGLGLSISHSIVQKHKGSISVESSVGVGTTFTITLPIIQKNKGT